ncbi:DUF4345 domain-containing protein [Fluctibacter halophilus]|nr:DUF4345 domain-containing protein [Aestuariibacter halophilus]
MNWLRQPTSSLLRWYAVFIAAAGLFYGAIPQFTVQLFAATDVHPDSLHVFRAIMGLYLGIALFLLLCSRHHRHHRPGLLCVVLFMWGLAAGRLLSIMIDPTWPVFAPVAATIETLLGLYALLMALASDRNTD